MDFFIMKTKKVFLWGGGLCIPRHLSTMPYGDHNIFSQRISDRVFQL